MKDKSKVLKTYGYMFDKLKFEILYKMFQNAQNRHCGCKRVRDASIYTSKKYRSSFYS